MQWRYPLATLTAEKNPAWNVLNSHVLPHKNTSGLPRHWHASAPTWQTEAVASISDAATPRPLSSLAPRLRSQAEKAPKVCWAISRKKKRNFGLRGATVSARVQLGEWRRPASKAASVEILCSLLVVKNAHEWNMWLSSLPAPLLVVWLSHTHSFTSPLLHSVELLQAAASAPKAGVRCFNLNHFSWRLFPGFNIFIPLDKEVNVNFLMAPG